MTEDELQRDVAIITGAATGVGKAIALELSRRGAAVVISDIDDELGATTVSEIEKAGGRATYFHADVRSEADLTALVEHTTTSFGDPTIAVANMMSGEGGQGPIWESNLDGARRMFDTLVFGLFSAVHVLAPALIASADKGVPSRLLIVGSEHSLGVPPHVPAMSAYTVAKYAALGVTDTARRDLQASGVSVTLVAPSWVRTEKLEALVRSSTEMAMMVEPYAQDAHIVASMAVDGLVRGDYITATNPVIREFALAHGREVMGAIQMLPASNDDMRTHSGSGDPAKCPVVGSF
jgi:NAD(P)-dependent dehydrogenase (short-subunit alcohol dehydrogenase family)